MSGKQTVIAGIPLPSDAPLFLALVTVHVAAGLVCVIAGAVAMLCRKQRGRHPQAGTVYYWSLCRCGRHHGRSGDLPMGGGLSPFHSRGAVIPRRNDWPKGEAEAVARLGANPYDRDGRFLHPDDHGLLCGQWAESATMVGTASDRLLDITDSSRDTDLALRTASPSLGALSIERRSFQTGHYRLKPSSWGKAKRLPCGLRRPT